MRRSVEFVTSDRRAGELWPPAPAGEARPDWFRRSARYLRDRAFPNLRLRTEVTIRGCPAVEDYLSLGHIVPLWSDYLVTLGDSGFVVDAPEAREFDAFTPPRWDACPRLEGETGWVLKLHTPWRVVAPPGWSILALPTWFHRDARFDVMPGLIEADRYNALVAVIVWKLPPGETTLLRAGTPLLHLVAVPRRSPAGEVIVDPDWDADLCERAAMAHRRLAPGGYREVTR